MRHLPFTRTVCLLALCSVLMTPAVRAHEGHHPSKTDAMKPAAEKFLATLTPELKKKAVYAFDGEERKNWHFIPKDRIGVSLKEMNLEQRKAAHALLKAPLSSKGYLKATVIMSLELVLHHIEMAQPTRKHDRDQERYWFVFFGSPSDDKPWGWRVEGHHLSLNFTSVDGMRTATTPSFYGANPAEVRTGPRAGLRVLAAEEDLARDLMASLTEAQSKSAILPIEAPRDVITGPGQSIDIGKRVGLSSAEMTEAQRKVLWALMIEYAGNLRGDLAKAELVEIKKNNPDEIHFAWAGTLERGEPHYYRIHGPSFIIEYDNTQNDANHIHTVWHSLSNDFGVDTLRRHYEANKHKK